MPPALLAALPAIAAVGSTVGGIASMVKAGQQGDKLDAQMDRTDKQRNDLMSTIGGNQSNMTGAGSVGTPSTGIGSVGMNTPTPAPMAKSFSNNPGLGKLSGFGG